ncbi:MAG: type II toxin-antitoxin system mRNA interferase toxin, RelE/StbE family [Proteobacteria bacterium]|nr:type II toxin-antitoxin system mRNA interferase toxin, RelE/StbE family [Pseudomonadota bacterium]
MRKILSGCHIEPDWLLIYKVEDHQIIFERTGTHSDLFRKQEL